MRKLFLSILAVMFFAGIAFADGGALHSISPDYNLGIYTFVQTSNFGTIGDLSSTFIAGTRLLGYTITNPSEAGEFMLYDTASGNAGATVANRLLEGGCASGAETTVWFPFPKKINNGIYIDVDSTTTRVTLYYVG